MRERLRFFGGFQHRVSSGHCLRILQALVAGLSSVLLAAGAEAQIARHPTGVNVSAMGATTVLLTFGHLNGKVPAEALWCGALIPASPDIGDRCDPATIYGRLPLRYDLSRASGGDGLTDIMSIPASVARRAYQDAARGAASAFYYVRRFVDPNGGPDEYVTVTCRMTDGGARTPFALVDVQLAFGTEDLIVAVGRGEQVPPVAARIAHTGTGRLRGRWEIVRPGEERPRAEDLLPEASLPLERRGAQRRYTELARFDVFLPPGGEFTLEGPDPDRLPSDADGEYLLLLRIEASDDKEADSDLGAANAGNGLVHAGGVAGFALPVLRYHVGSMASVGVASAGLRTLAPAAGATIPADSALAFRWTPAAGARLYRLEIRDASGAVLLDAVTRPPVTRYTVPAWLLDRIGMEPFQWRVAALGTGGRTVVVTAWQQARRLPPSPGDQPPRR